MLVLKKLYFCIAISLCMIGCSSKNSVGSWMERKSVKILSTTAQIGDLVALIGGDRVAVLVLIQGDLDPHSYEIVKGDGEKFERADLIFYNGLGLEHGASLSSLLQSNPKAFSIGSKLPKEKILKKGDSLDPHVWMDVSLWAQAIAPITEELIRKDPEGALYFKERALVLQNQMEFLHHKVRSILEQVPSEKRYLVTSHDAFQYFARAYLSSPGDSDWSSRIAAPEGLAPEGQLKPSDLQEMIDFVKKHHVSVLFPESNVSKDSIKKIAAAGKELGLTVKICEKPLYGDSMSSLSYAEMIQTNAETIAKGLE